LLELTGAIAWAEQGYVPLKEDRQGSGLWLEEEAVDWEIFQLMEEYEELFDQLNPFVYDDFRVALMHEFADDDHAQNMSFVVMEYEFRVDRL
jgi:hypothetical protein